MAQDIQNPDQDSAIPGYRRWLWLVLAFAAGFVMPFMTAASFYLPLPFGPLPLVYFFLATPLTFPLFATLMALRARRRNRPDPRPDGGVIFLMALAELALVLIGVAAFYLTAAEIPVIHNVMDIGGHIA
jgi:hypothetical protein